MLDSADLEALPYEVAGRLPYSSNATFLVRLGGDDAALAVYKPRDGERPLWDFPPGLDRRERASHLLSQQLGWDLVPPTVLRDDGPLGAGSLQAFVDADFEQHYFTLLEDERHHPRLRQLAVFDLLANSTDRKGGHVLIDGAGHIWAIDNGLTFHHEFKLRTVIWDFAGETIDDNVLADVARLVDAGPQGALCELLDPFERDALLTRATAVVREARFPHDPTGRRWPWPVV